MASPMLSRIEIANELTRLSPSSHTKFSIGETSILNVYTGAVVEYSTSDLLMPMEQFSEKVLRPLFSDELPKDTVAEITTARGSVYGPFLHNALVAQHIKAAMRALPDPDNEGLKWENLPIDVREGLDLIALKISRIVTGDPEYLDNWDDIGGYAKIVADRIRKSRTKKGKKHA